MAGASAVTDPLVIEAGETPTYRRNVFAQVPSQTT
jgi:hypothetical protein